MMEHTWNNIFDFVVIGMPKCGTTYTYQLLEEHPDVAMSSSKIGIKGGYFLPGETMNKKGLITHVVGNKYKPGSLAGEFKEGYTTFEGAEKKMSEHNPQMKIVVCLRNPYDRSYSSYKHRASVGDFVSFETEEDMLHIFEYSYFYKRLKPYKELFDDILFLPFDELVSSPKTYREKLYTFLNIDTTFIPSTEGKQLNDTRFKGTSLGRFIHNILLPAIDSLGLGRILRSSQTLRSLFYTFGNFVGKRAKPHTQNLLSKEEFMQKIEGIYDEDLRKLEEEFGIML